MLACVNMGCMCAGNALILISKPRVVFNYTASFMSVIV